MQNSQFLGIFKNKALAPVAVVQNGEAKEELELLDLNQKIAKVSTDLNKSKAAPKKSFLQKELEILQNALAQLREAKKVLAAR